MSNQKIALIDGDVLCYLACKPRWLNKLKNGINVIELDSEGNKVALEHTQEEDAKYLADSWKRFQQEIDSIVEATFATSYMMAVKGDDNFRDVIYLDYKRHRKERTPHPSSPKPAFVKTLRNLSVYYDLSVPAHGREADDLLRIWAGECEQQGHEYVIVTIDKDLQCIPGLFYNPKTQVNFAVSVEEAKRHYYQQLIKGDPTDNIPGVKGVGDVGAKKAIDAAANEEEMQEAVIAAYINAYDDDWREYLLVNGKLIHLQENIDDFFTLTDWALAQELS